MKRKQAIQIGDNVGSIMKLPCVEQCFKTVSGNIRFEGTFECKRRYAIHGDWLVEFDDGKWRCMSSEEFERIKDR